MAGLIATVTLNLALDVTYGVDELVVGGSHRVTDIRQRAGGKGVNVARVATTLGHQVLALGFVGGVTGEIVAEELFDAGLTALLTPIAAETRRTVAIVSGADGDATIFNELGPVVSADEWRAFHDRMPWARLGVLACSGSLPPGLPADAYAELAVRARHHDVLSVIDAGGDALAAAAKAGAVVRSNAAELRDALGDVDVEEGARQLVELGAAAAVITNGARGMVAASKHGAWCALPVEQVAGNPTGAGDACTAVVAAAVAESPEPDWAVVLKSAVAASAAAVLTPVAGDIDLAAYRRWQPQVEVQSL
ncbi:1-phosphofructokinase family hexose kinase [Kribbella sp. VKM Ac-2568]|uniref:1-phosphofructokinase family hexose kinase n=1 Tax=Kribbella sp. VKM Ac-2568 TaxID=2512219 RepID=UPI00104D84AA|nr:hexose kinase [Kribbella sp. VKM Ac-2568]TCM41719.1 tagatose 6-phosphate kinase [Kribbella sp. VKM Ac-2568]